MASGISLANKCQLLFGFAVLLILAAALAVPWVWSQRLVRESQADVARQVADAWLNGEITLGSLWYTGQPRDLAGLTGADESSDESIWLTFVDLAAIDEDDLEPFVAGARTRFLDDPELLEHVRLTEVDGLPIYRFARAIRRSQLRAIRDPLVTDFSASPIDPQLADPLVAILLIDRRSAFAESRLLMGKIYIMKNDMGKLLKRYRRDFSVN